MRYHLRQVRHLEEELRYTKENLQATVKELENKIEYSKPSSFEIRNIDDNWFLMELNLYKNEITGVVVTFVEITLLKEVSAQISQRNEDLQSFACAISHDLNEPIRILTSPSELLIKKTGQQKDEETQSYTKEIKNSSERIKGMLNGTLEFSRVITDDENFTELSLIDCLDNAKNELEKEIEQSNAYILSEDLPPLFNVIPLR